MLLLFGVSLIFAVIISIYVKYYEAISLIIFLGVYGYLFLYGVIMVITPLIPPDEEDIIEYRKKDALHRKYFLEDWLVAWCFLMVLIIGIGAYITVDSMKHKEIVEIEQSTYIKNVEKHEVRVTTWYDIYDVTYQYDGEECVDRVRYNDKFVPWTIKAEHSYVYVDEDIETVDLTITLNDLLAELKLLDETEYEVDYLKEDVARMLLYYRKQNKVKLQLEKDKAIVF